jgi:hypothetical protein
MNDREVLLNQAEAECAGNPARRSAVAPAAWSFIYVFFSNGTPYDAPNRSETC